MECKKAHNIIFIKEGMGRDVQLFSKRTKKSEKSLKITHIEKDGDELQ